MLSKEALVVLNDHNPLRMLFRGLYWTAVLRDELPLLDLLSQLPQFTFKLHASHDLQRLALV
jgi:hypothetical protein